MIKEEYLASIGIALLSVAFTTISLLLYFNKNSRWLVDRKIKLGTVMLSLTVAISSCSKPTVTCYDPIVEEDTTEVDNGDTSVVKVDNNEPELIDIETLITE